jgi:phage shock protein PspC (stress-responsive transcriptional regulator)
MTTNEPLDHLPSDPSSSTGQPSWGTAPSTPPTGAGTDDPGQAFGSPQPGPTTPPGARFFDNIRGLQVIRPDHGQGRCIAGVASGIARRYQVDPLVARIAFIILSLFAGLGILLYGLGWLFLPHPDGRIHAQQVLTGTVTPGFVGALLTVLAIAHDLIPVLLVALIIWLVVRHRRSNRPHACC